MPSGILKLLEDPFGPYPDYLILNPDWPRRGGPATRPVLSSVHMKCGGDDIGLDETELLREALPTSRIVRHPVIVFGVLEIETLDWLSETGKEWLGRDLNIRDDEKKLKGKPSRLTLEGIYGDGVNSGSRIEVWLQINKIMNAAYMTLDDDPTSLVLYAEDHNRSFCIKSLDVKTYNLSRNFMERYRIRRLIHQLINGSDTPIESRDIEWLITQYLAQIAPLDRNFRIIYDHNDTSHSFNKRGDMVLKMPRHPRPLHRATIRRLFAAQAEWILADQIASSSPNGRYLDIRQWVEFIKQVKIARRAAREQGTRWGEPWNRENEDDGSGDIDLSQFGGTRENWNQRLRNALSNRQSHPKQVHNFKSTPTPSAVELLSERQATRLPPPPAKKELPKRRVIQVEYQYDSDFSEASTSSAPDSEPEPDLQHDRYLEARIPWYCCEPPVLEPTQYVWRCPGCHDYKIDLLDPDENELQEIPEEYANLLRTKSWTRIAEEDVMMALGHLVNNHYAGHLRALGVHVVSQGNKAAVRKWPEGKRKSRRLGKSSAGDVSQYR